MAEERAKKYMILRVDKIVDAILIGANIEIFVLSYVFITHRNDSFSALILVGFVLITVFQTADLRA